ncbi:MAG: MFS transporter [Myxococcales bacterium]|nr:MFS transporter [Myxococcales bacterium]
MSEPARLLTKPFGLLVAGHFMQALGYSSMLLLPLYLQELRASRTEIGLAMGIAAVAGLLTRPVVGWGLDRWGRKPLLLAGTLLASLGMVLIAGVTRMGPLIYLQRMIFGIGEGVLFTAYFTFAADLVPASRRTEGLALFGVSGLVPMLINPLSDVIGITPPSLRWFIPALGGIVAASALPLIPLRDSAREGTAERPPMRAAWPVLSHRKLWSVWLAAAAFSALVAIFMTFATVAARRQGIERAPSLWLSYALGAVSVRVFGGRLPDRLGPHNLVAPAIAAYVTAMLLAGRAESFSDFLVAALLAGVGHGYCFPVLTSQVVTRSSADFRGTALAAFTAIWGLSELVTKDGAVAIADAYDDATMFLGAAAFGTLSLVGWAGLEHRFVSSADRSVA